MPAAAPSELIPCARGAAIVPPAPVDLRICEIKTGHTLPIRRLVALNDGHIACANADGSILIIRAATKATVCVLKGHTGQVYALALSPDGNTLASGGGDNMVRRWDVSTPAKAVASGKHEGHTATVAAVAWKGNHTVISGS